MSNNKPKAGDSKGKPSPAKPGSAPAPVTTTPTPPAQRPPSLFRRVDWITFAVTTVILLAGYFFTLALDLGLEDAGELATGSFYAGVSHPPVYPVWTIYAWLFAS